MHDESSLFPYQRKAINHQCTHPQSMLCQRIHELLMYDSETGNFTWKVTKSSTAVAGQRAGSVNAHGHVNLQIDRKMYAAHQLVFLIHRGYIPKEIDHINRVKTDNRWVNLREATFRLNAINQTIDSNNTSGHKGSHFNRKSGKWHATIRIDGFKRFIGSYPTAQEAAMVYAVAAHYFQPHNPDAMNLPEQSAHKAVRHYLGRYLTDGTTDRL